jgi:hypothetical protein
MLSGPHSPADTAPGSRGGWRTAGCVLAFACVLGGLEAMSLHVGMERLGRPISWPRALAGTLPSWLVLAVLAWPVRELARRVRLGPGSWKASLPVHIVAAAVFIAITCVSTAQVNGWLGTLDGEPVHAAAVRYFFTWLAYDVVIYGTLVGAFHAVDYVRESESRERERARLAASLIETRLHVLRSQLSPHFFFNTLNAISTFALQGRPAQVGEMVGALGALVRVSLDDQLGHQVPLVQELEYLELYLEIQRVRFADWLRIEKHVAPEVFDVLVPSLILQPLMENAIEHGVPGPDGIMSVRLSCDLEGDALRIEIANPGPADVREAWSPRTGVGLRNTQERLEQIHPGRHEFRYGPAEETGFRVVMRIPARRLNAGIEARETAS